MPTSFPTPMPDLPLDFEGFYLGHQLSVARTQRRSRRHTFMCLIVGGNRCRIAQEEGRRWRLALR